MTDAVTLEIQDDIAIIRLDDGRANALNYAILEALNVALSKAEEQAKAVVLLGRAGKLFSAGFDMAIMQAGPASQAELVAAGGTFAARLYASPIPVVLGCPGHAIAMGAVLLTSVDYRIGTQGDFKICFNEVQIGMPLPEFLTVLAVDRLNPKYLDRAILQSELFTPSLAVEAGLFDEIVAADQLDARAIEKAKALSLLNAEAFAESKFSVRGDSVARILESLADD